MIVLLVGIIIGALIGWHVPQPSWVKKTVTSAQNAVGSIKNEIDKVNKE